MILLAIARNLTRRSSSTQVSYTLTEGVLFHAQDEDEDEAEEGHDEL